MLKNKRLFSLDVFIVRNFRYSTVHCTLLLWKEICLNVTPQFCHAMQVSPSFNDTMFGFIAGNQPGTNARGLASPWPTSEQHRPVGLLLKMAEKVLETNKQCISPNDQGQRGFWHFFLVLNSVQKFETLQGPAIFGSPTFAKVTKEIIKHVVSTERRTFVDDNKSNWHVTFDWVFLSNTGCVNHKL